MNKNYRFFLSGYLSNWYMCRIEYDGITFYNSEQLFMYFKALSFRDFKTAELIQKEPNPAEAKALGRLVAHFDPAVWDNIKYSMMYFAVSLKFGQNIELEELLFTDSIDYPDGFVECNPVDKIWGIGYSVKDAPDSDPATWGQNLLGKVLNKVAESLY